MELKLKDKVAVVTGASRGIGRKVAERMSAEGATVIMVSRTVSPDDIEALLAEGRKCEAYACDVSDYTQVETMVNYIVKKYSKIDILANVAGISPKMNGGEKIKFYDQTVEQWNEVMDVNLNSVFYVSKCVVPYMMKQRYGRIINMSSIVGLTNSEHGPACAAYVTSKTGMIGLTRAMAYDLAEYGITVNAIAGGRISTNMSAANSEYYNELHKKLIPMHRFGTTDEVADLFLFLASDCSTYITGETINITGGWFI